MSNEKLCAQCHVKPVTGKAKFCSNACKMKFTRAAKKAGADPKTGEVIDKKDWDGANSAEIHKAPDTLTKAKAPYDREKHRKAFIEMGVAKVNWLSSGIPEFDALTRIPRGRITQIQGRFGVGKTTLCLNMIKGMEGTRTLYIDAEAALTPDILEELEIDSDLFTLYNESNYIEDIAEVVQAAAKSGDYDLIVLDSVPMTDTKVSDDNDITARNIGQKAFILHKLVQRIAMDLKRTDTAMVFINQVRDYIGGYFPQEYTPGGTAIPYQASLIVHLKTIPSWRFPDKPKDKIYRGHEVLAEIKKSKVNTPHRQAKFKLIYPQPRQEEDRATF